MANNIYANPIPSPLPPPPPSPGKCAPSDIFTTRWSLIYRKYFQYHTKLHPSQQRQLLELRFIQNMFVVSKEQVELREVIR